MVADPAEVKLTSKCTYGKGECPDCGSRQADYKMVEIWSKGLSEGAWVEINCQACGYYIYEYRGKE